MKNFHLAFTLVALLSACSVPYTYQCTVLENLQIGVATRQDFIRVFDIPTLTSSYKEGYERWQWNFDNRPPGRSDRLAMLVVVFHPDGTLYQISKVVRD